MRLYVVGMNIVIYKMWKRWTEEMREEQRQIETYHKHNHCWHSRPSCNMLMEPFYFLILFVEVLKVQNC